jgi:hypothetical protein
MEIKFSDDMEQDVLAAVGRAVKDVIDGVADKFKNTTIHDNCGQDTAYTSKNASVFILCQHFLSVPGITDVSLDYLRPYVEMFWDHVSDYDRFGESVDDAIGRFESLWDSWKTAHARGPILEIAIRYAENGFRTPPETERYRTAPMRKLVHVCYLLAMIHRAHGLFFLSVENAGKIMGKDRNLGSVAMKRLCLENVIGLVEKGNKSSGKASTYVYFATNFNEAMNL